jgi:hypothetical protein
MEPTVCWWKSVVAVTTMKLSVFAAVTLLLSLARPTIAADGDSCLTEIEASKDCYRDGGLNADCSADQDAIVACIGELFTIDHCQGLLGSMNACRSIVGCSVCGTSTLQCDTHCSSDDGFGCSVGSCSSCDQWVPDIDRCMASVCTCDGSGADSHVGLKAAAGAAALLFLC